MWILKKRKKLMNGMSTGYIGFICMIIYLSLKKSFNTYLNMYVR